MGAGCRKSSGRVRAFAALILLAFGSGDPIAAADEPGAAKGVRPARRLESGTSNPTLYDLGQFLAANVDRPPLLNHDTDGDGRVTAADAVRLFRPDHDPCRRVQRLLGPGLTETVGGVPWGSDLGVLVPHGGELWMLVGDVIGDGVFAPNTAARTPDTLAVDGLPFSWRTDPGGYPLPFFPRIDPDSTVPAGALSVDGNLYVFLMDVLDWDEPVRARAVLACSVDVGSSFQTVWTGPESNRLVNVSPARGPHPDDPGQEVVYLAASGAYRRSPVYLAWCDPADLGSPDRYAWFRGVAGGVPQWGEGVAAAVPVLDGVKAGELCLRRNAYLGGWLLSLFDYTTGSLGFWRAASPWGPWTPGRPVFTPGTRDWYEAGWYGPYGGYSDPALDRGGGQVVYFTLSLWVPYAVFLMETDLALIFP
ncbi:MAG: DUF4185 domain-containing protein [Acidobacteria bacterium]|nr:DUF4185 domain-containing protein [Acidobacteriota bacterium]